MTSLRAPSGLGVGPYQLPGIYLLAPMAGLVSTPFRGLAREFGAAATPTELISANGLVQRNPRTFEMLQPAPGEAPYWVQLFGSEPANMARAAVIAVERGAQILDVNMGCPVRKVVNDGAGSALMREPARAAAIVAAMRSAVGEAVPVTVKFRAGWDLEQRNAVDFGKAMEQAGAALLCLHPRTRTQMYSGRSDWSYIGALKQSVRVPVVGNGDVHGPADAQRMRDETGCDGVMVGRAALGNPWLFRALVTGIEAVPSPAERCRVVLDHFARLGNYCGTEHSALYPFRSQLVPYTRGLVGSAELRRQIMSIDDPARLREVLIGFFAHARPAHPLPGDDLEVALASGGPS